MLLKRLVCTWLFLLSAPLAAAAAEPVASAATAPVRVGSAMRDPVSAQMLGQLLLGLVVVVLAIFIVLWMLKRFTGIGVQSRHLRVVAALPLGSREKAVLVQVGERQLLLGVAPGRVSLLERFEQPVVELSSGDGFGARLREALDRKDGR